MKKLLALFLSVALLTSFTPALADKAENLEAGMYSHFSEYVYQPEDVAVIANFRVADRLNLREEPKSDAKSLGRFYSGVKVAVLEEREEGWVRVRLGGLIGYVQKGYLMPSNRNYETPTVDWIAEPAGTAISLLSEARSSASVVTTTSAEVAVLGDVGDDWRYVETSDGQYGYARAARLTNFHVDIPLGYARAADGSAEVSVYQDKERTRKGALLYTGVRLKVTDVSRSGGWAYIQCAGEVMDRQYAGRTITGYIALEDLLVFTHFWQVKEQFAAARVAQDFSMTPLSGNKERKLVQGMMVAVAGRVGDEYLVRVDNDTAFVSQSLVTLTGGKADKYGPEAIGFACPQVTADLDGWSTYPVWYDYPGGDSLGELTQNQVQVIAHLDGWYQVRGRSCTGFLKEEDVRAVQAADAFLRAPQASYPAGTWTVETEGLYLYQGGEGKFTLRRPGEEAETVYSLTADASYVFFLPKGAEATLSGSGEMRGVDGYQLDSLYVSNRWFPYDHPVPREEEAIFSGSGRFLADWQLAAEAGWFDYIIQPLPGAEDAYFTLSTLFEEGDPVYFVPSGAERLGVSIEPGEFLEVHHCQIFLNFGNG